MNCIRALGVTLLCTLPVILAQPEIGFAQTDSTKADWLNVLDERRTVDQTASSGTSGRITDWGLRDRVLKLTAPSQFSGEMIGRLSAVAGDTLVIEQYKKRESNYLRVPVSEITRCQVHAGTKGHFLTGLLVGTVVGCGTSLLLVATDDESHDFIDLSGFAVGVGTVGGAVLGGLIGAFARTDQWEPVPIGSLSVGIHQSSDGTAGLSLSLKF